MIGDVSGHGPDEAALGTSLRIGWRTLMLAERPLDEALVTLDRVLTHERHHPDIFATAAFVRAASRARAGRPLRRRRTRRRC